jgi:acyl-CoA thioester hydrolase
MGVAHHSHYFVWFELGRTEWMRELGIPYADLETQDGAFLPVVEAGAAYHVSARYDDRLLVTTRLCWSKRVRMRLEYEITREDDGAVLATGFTVHACVDREGRPRRLPDRLLGRIGAGAGGEA